MLYDTPFAANINQPRTRNVRWTDVRLTILFHARVVYTRPGRWDAVRRWLYRWYDYNLSPIKITLRRMSTITGVSLSSFYGFWRRACVVSEAFSLQEHFCWDSKRSSREPSLIYRHFTWTLILDYRVVKLVFVLRLEGSFFLPAYVRLPSLSDS